MKARLIERTRGCESSDEVKSFRPADHGKKGRRKLAHARTDMAKTILFGLFGESIIAIYVNNVAVPGNHGCVSGELQLLHRTAFQD
jgi:hypothetical protein